MTRGPDIQNAAPTESTTIRFAMDGIANVVLTHAASLDSSDSSENASLQNSCRAVNAIEGRATSDKAVHQFDSILCDLAYGLEQFHQLQALLTAQRNFHVPVNKLPPEILSLIFSICSDSLIEDVPRKRPTGHPLIPLSHTCSRWREICLNQSILWKSFDTTHRSERLAQLVLERGRNCTLKFALVTSLSRRPIVDLLLDNLDRVEHLFLDIQSRDIHKMVTHVPFKSLSRLKRLSLMNMRRGAECYLPTKLFGGAADQLRIVDFDSARMPWAPGYYSNLTSLKVTNCYVGACMERDRNIRCVLEDCPNLEILELGFITPQGWITSRDTVIADGTARRIPLKSLRTIDLTAPVDYVQYILSGIESPSVTKLSMSLGHVYGPDTKVPALLGPEHFPPKIFPSIRRLAATARAGSSPSKLEGLTPDGDIVFWLTWSDGDPTSLTQLCIFEWIADVILQNHSTPELQHVDLRSNVEMTEGPHSFTSFTAFPTIRTLELVDLGAASVLERMLDERVWTRAGGWPNLSTIHVGPLLEHRVTAALVGLCTKHATLRNVDLSHSIVQAWSREDLATFVRDLRAIDASVDYHDCEFEDLSTFDGYSSPDAVLHYESKLTHEASLEIGSFGWR